MFSSVLPGLDNSLASQRDRPRFPDLREMAACDPEIFSLLWHPDFGKGGGFDEQLRARAVMPVVSPPTAFAVVPLYVTSICRERCTYCNYRSTNRGEQVTRVRLDAAGLEREVRFLIEERGLRGIELVYASDPLKGVESMCRDIELVRELLEVAGGGSVGINVDALETSDYNLMMSAGLSFAVLWQETYDRETYARVHPGSRGKARFEWRLEAYERMIEAGLQSFGMGVLSGLADWRMDWFFLLNHERYLRSTYGVSPAVLGIPRFRPVPGCENPGSSVPTAGELAALVALHRIWSPDTVPFINTRDTWDLCMKLARMGDSLFTFDCSTIPGGYSLGTQGFQFPTFTFDARIFVPKLQTAGIRVEFNWDFTPDSARLGMRELVSTRD